VGISPPVVVRVEGRVDAALHLLRPALRLTERTEEILESPEETARRLREMRHATGAVAKALRRSIKDLER
jgi:hypothetical protein